MSRRDWGDAAAAVFVLALVALAVRPTSVAPAFITAFGGALVAIVGFAANPGPPLAGAAGSAGSTSGGPVFA